MKALFLPGVLLKYSVILAATVLIMFFCPQWVLILLCVVVAGLYKKWYNNQGFIFLAFTVVLFIVFPMALQWGFQIWPVQLLQSVYNFISPAIPRPVLIPLVSVSLDPFQVSANLDPTVITTLFLLLVVLTGGIVLRIRRASQAVYMFCSVVLVFYELLVGVAWVSWLLRVFSMGAIDIQTALFAWESWPILYHIIFNIIPLTVVFISLSKLAGRIVSL